MVRGWWRRHRQPQAPVGVPGADRPGSGSPSRPISAMAADGSPSTPPGSSCAGGSAPGQAVDRHGEWVPPVPLLRVTDRRRGSLVVARGELVSIVGLSGAGKTRWVRSLVGLQDPFDTALLDGEPLSPATIATSVGWVGERGSVMTSTTALANVMVPVGVPVSREQALDALDLVGLAGRAGDAASSLNGSEHRRIALARCVARRARLLVVDGALDPVFWPLFPCLCRQLPFVDGVVVTQSCVDEVTSGATSVALLCDGAIVAQDSLDRLRRTSDPAIRQMLGALER